MINAPRGTTASSSSTAAVTSAPLGRASSTTAASRPTSVVVSTTLAPRPTSGNALEAVRLHATTLCPAASSCSAIG